MAINRTSPKKGKVVDIPTAPTIGTATAGAESATVAFTAATKGGPATTYTALSNPGSVTGTGSSSPVTVSGLTAGTSYTFTVRGNNATGSGEYSSASNSITALVGSAYESIQTVTVGAGGSSTVSFTSIPSTYKHLQVRGIALGSAAASGSLQCQVNSDTASNYTRHELGGNGSVAFAYAGSSQSSVNMYGYHDNIANNNFPLAVVMDILDYQNSNKYKTFRVLSGMDKNGANYGEVFLKSSVWMSTSAISSISIYIGGQNLAQYSQFALYGIKG